VSRRLHTKPNRWKVSLFRCISAKEWSPPERPLVCHRSKTLNKINNIGCCRNHSFCASDLEVPLDLSPIDGKLLEFTFFSIELHIVLFVDYAGFWTTKMIILVVVIVVLMVLFVLWFVGKKLQWFAKLKWFTRLKQYFIRNMSVTRDM